MTEAKQLTIRIKFLPEKDKTPKKDNGSDFHWGRIITVFLAVIVAIASLIGSTSYYLNQEQIDSEYVKSDSNNISPDSISSPASVSSKITAIEIQKTPSVARQKPESQALAIAASATIPSAENSNITTTPEKITATFKSSPPAEEKTTPEETTVMTSSAAEDNTTPEEAAVMSSSAAEESTMTEKDTVMTPPAVEESTTYEESTVMSRSAAEENTMTKKDTVMTPPAVEESTTYEESTVMSPSAAEENTMTEKDTVMTQPAAEDNTTSEEATAINPSATEESTTPEEVSIIKPAIAESNTPSEALFTQSKKDLLSEHIVRFVISQTVEDNEPVGNINDIHFDDNNIATVYAYSEVDQLADQTIYYQWTLNGKNIAKVKVDVGASSWRSYSSKFIQPHMHGEWKVELQNQAGEKLASNKFYY